MAWANRLRNATTGQTRIRLEQAIIFVHQNWHYSSVIPCTSIRIDEGRSTVPNLGRTLLRSKNHSRTFDVTAISESIKQKCPVLPGQHLINTWFPTSHHLTIIEAPSAGRCPWCPGRLDQIPAKQRASPGSPAATSAAQKQRELQRPLEDVAIHESYADVCQWLPMPNSYQFIYISFIYVFILIYHN